MEKLEKLTPEKLELNNYDKIFISNRKFENVEDEIEYYKDLVYGIKKIFGIKYTYDEKTEERLSTRLTPVREVRLKETIGGYSDFAREFYYIYILAKKNFKDETPLKTTKELAKIFTRERVKSNIVNVWPIRG